MSEIINLSSSKFQLQLEGEIVEAIGNHLKTPIFSQCIKDKNASFHFDFTDTNEEPSVIGEIYTCRFPLKSGHQRKINTDILKMITYEALVGKSIQKYMVLTISEADVIDRNSVSSDSRIIPDNDDFSMFGKKSWFAETIKRFAIKILYVVLSDDEQQQLTDVRMKQTEGMKIKGGI